MHAFNCVSSKLETRLPNGRIHATRPAKAIIEGRFMRNTIRLKFELAVSIAILAVSGVSARAQASYSPPNESGSRPDGFEEIRQI